MTPLGSVVGRLNSFILFLRFLLDSLYDLKDFGVWACSKVLQDGVYQVCGEFDVVHYQGTPVAVVGFFCAAICAARFASIASTSSLSLTQAMT